MLQKGAQPPSRLSRGDKWMHARWLLLLKLATPKLGQLAAKFWRNRGYILSKMWRSQLLFADRRVAMRRGNASRP
jgi:hypothetical protein